MANLFFCTGECRFVIPGQPLLGTFEYFPGMLLKRRQEIEGIHFIQITGMDQAHKKIANVRPMFGLEEETVVPVQNSLFKCSFANIVVQGRAGLPPKKRQSLPMLEHVRNRLP